MKIHPSLKPTLWGAVGGAVALAIIGFSWGGWVTGGTSRSLAMTDSVLQLAALKKVSSYDRTSLVEKAGWATMPGSTAPGSGVAKACAGLIANLK